MQKTRRWVHPWLGRLAMALFLPLLTAAAAFPRLAAQDDEATPPDHVIKLTFIHHSSGEAWLADEHGGLGRALGENNYFVSDTNYGWGPEAIGDRTDIPNWLEWFRGPTSDEILQALYRESGQNAGYTRDLADPGGENEIILFKSCFPNSNLSGNPDDAAAPGEDYSVSHAKHVYNEILQYFATRPDKLFVVITAPPVQDATFAENARAFNNWLVYDWLRENAYQQSNVAVFDFYNVLTGPDHHHRLVNGEIEHVWVDGRNTAYYPSSAGDDHPSAAGDRKATEEFVPLLNIFYHRWQAGGVPASPPSDPDASQAAATQTAPSAAGSALIDDFEAESPSGAAGWVASRGEELPARLECAPSTDAAAQGRASLRLDFDVPTGSWAICALSYESPQDWSGSEGVQFQLRSSGAGVPFDVLLFAGTPESMETYISYQQAPPASAEAWAPFGLAWGDFTRVAWEENAGDPFNAADRVLGLGFGFDGLEGGANLGSVWVDDLRLTEDGVPSAAVAPEEAEDETQAPGGPRLPCIGGAALPPLVLGWLWLGRRTHVKDRAP